MDLQNEPKGFLGLKANADPNRNEARINAVAATRYFLFNFNLFSPPYIKCEQKMILVEFSFMIFEVVSIGS